MISVSKLDEDENNSLIIIIDKKEFKTFSKKFKKKTGYDVQAFFNVKQISKDTIKLTPQISMLDNNDINTLANITVEIIKEMKNYRVSLDGLYRILIKLRRGEAKITKSLLYSLKVAEGLLQKKQFRKFINT